ncbi:MAG: glycosyltransferase [Candidatus Nanopelagicales bacterium]
MSLRVLFVDHPLHLRTQSSNFMVRAMRESGWDVVEFHVQDRLPDVPDASQFDVAVVWQQEHLLPWLHQSGIPTVVVPMLDGVASVPDAYWQLLGDSLVVCFSLTLEQRLAGLGHRTCLARFFPPPAERPQPRLRELRGFLWERQPGGWLDAPTVNHLFGEQLASLHVHLAPDAGRSTSRQLLQQFRMPRVSTSTWSGDSSAYWQALRGANVAFAPRPMEGIGMAFLEAMSLGICVVAADLPTHNEYITHGLTGYLLPYDLSNIPELNLDRVHGIASRAWDCVRTGHQAWKSEGLPNLLAAIQAEVGRRSIAGSFGVIASNVATIGLRNHAELVEFIEARGDQVLVFPPSRESAQVPLRVAAESVPDLRSALESHEFRIAPNSSVRISVASTDESAMFVTDLGLQKSQLTDLQSRLPAGSDSADGLLPPRVSEDSPKTNSDAKIVPVVGALAILRSHGSALVVSNTDPDIDLRVFVNGLFAAEQFAPRVYGQLLQHDIFSEVPVSLRSLVMQAWIDHARHSSESQLVDEATVLQLAFDWIMDAVLRGDRTLPVPFLDALQSWSWRLRLREGFDGYCPSRITKAAIDWRYQRDLAMQARFARDSALALGWFYIHGVAELDLEQLIPSEEVDWLLGADDSSPKEPPIQALLDAWLSGSVVERSPKRPKLPAIGLWSSQPELEWLLRRCADRNHSHDKTVEAKR